MKIPNLDNFETYYGLRVADIGEDGALIVLGHHEKRRVLGALNKHARTFWGLDDLYDGRLPMFSNFRATDEIQERWAVLDLERTKGGDWFIDYGVTEETPEAFPVMVWSS